jgi:hypothetical protein
MGSTPPVTSSTSPVTFEADAVPISNLGLLVVTIVEVTATTMNVSTTSVTIPMILEWAKANAMPLFDPGSPVDTVTEVLVAYAFSIEASGKADQKSSPAKGLLRQGFLGSSPAPSLSALVAKEVCPTPQQLGTSPFLTAGSSVSSRGAVEMGTTRLRLSHPDMTDSGTPIYSSVSKSHKGILRG